MWLLLLLWFCMNFSRAFILAPQRYTPPTRTSVLRASMNDTEFLASRGYYSENYSTAWVCSDRGCVLREDTERPVDATSRAFPETYTEICRERAERMYRLGE